MNIDLLGAAIVETELVVDEQRVRELAAAIGTTTGMDTALKVAFFGPTAAGQDSVIGPLDMDLRRALLGGQTYEWHRAFRVGESVRLRVHPRGHPRQGKLPAGDGARRVPRRRRPADPTPAHRLRRAVRPCRHRDWRRVGVSERVFERANHQARSSAHWCTSATGRIRRMTSGCTSERASLRASEPSGTVLGSWVHRRRPPNSSHQVRVRRVSERVFERANHQARCSAHGCTPRPASPTRRHRSGCASERASLRASEPSGTVFGSLVHQLVRVGSVE